MRELRRLGYLFLGATLTLGVAACGSSNEENDPINGSTDPGDKTKINTTLTVEQKKQELDKAAKEAIALVNSNDFTELDNLANYVRNNLSDLKADDKTDEWWKTTKKSFFEKLDRREGDVQFVKRILDLSKFTGHFTVENNKWVRTDASDLQVSFTDNNNKQCVLKLELSGEKTSAFVPFLDSYGWVDDGDRQVKTKLLAYLSVPEHAKLTLTRGGNTLLSAELNTKVKASATIDAAKDMVEANCKLTINKYVVEVKQALFEGSKGASFDALVKVGDKNLCHMIISANGKGTNERIESVGEVKMAVDILGKVQMKGLIDDGSNFNNYFQKIDLGFETRGKENYYYTEKEFKDLVTEANKHINAGIFLNGEKERIANIEIGAFQNKPHEDVGKDVGHWKGYALLKFDDNTSYAFNSYFSKKNFPDVFKQATNLIESFERMFNK